MCNYLIIRYLQRGAGVYEPMKSGGGATLKNFFAYFSASASYGFCKFQNMAQKQACMVQSNVNCLNS